MDIQKISGNSLAQLTVNDNNRSLSMCNSHATDAVTVDLYIKDCALASTCASTTFYILNNVIIPNGVTLKLTGDEFTYDKTTYNLFILLSASDSVVDVIIR